MFICAREHTCTQPNVRTSSHPSPHHTHKLSFQSKFIMNLTQVLPLSSIIIAKLVQHTCRSDWRNPYVPAVPKTTLPQSFNALKPVVIANVDYRNIFRSINTLQFTNIVFHYSLPSHFPKLYAQPREQPPCPCFIYLRKVFDLADNTVGITNAIKIGFYPYQVLPRRPHTPSLIIYSTILFFLQ